MGASAVAGPGRRRKGQWASFHHHHKRRGVPRPAGEALEGADIPSMRRLRAYVTEEVWGQDRIEPSVRIFSAPSTSLWRRTWI